MSLIISCGGCPNSCTSCMSSMRSLVLSGFVSYISTSFWKHPHCFSRMEYSSGSRLSLWSCSHCGNFCATCFMGSYINSFDKSCSIMPSIMASVSNPAPSPDSAPWNCSNMLFNSASSSPSFSMDGTSSPFSIVATLAMPSMRDDMASSKLFGLLRGGWRSLVVLPLPLPLPLYSSLDSTWLIKFFNRFSPSSLPSTASPSSASMNARSRFWNSAVGDVSTTFFLIDAIGDCSGLIMPSSCRRSFTSSPTLGNALSL
mmetsp:Transcript_19281/g.53631  ORF Transcript_19281/g.53631 Transcript_19281/m.53631 type:complete len:257 (+) Transcript_19281:199-969(+)